MQRRALLLLMIVLLVTGSATGVHASTDCQRWFIAYKQQLEHSQAVRRLRLAKARARRYARMKLAGYVRPKPVAKPHRHYPPRTRMTRAEVLRRYNLACGVLPEKEIDQQIIREEIPAAFSAQRSLDFLQPEDSDDQQMLASNPLPPPFADTGETPEYPTPGGPPVYMPPIGGFPGGPGGWIPPSGPTPPPVIPAVPEPGSLALLLTGLMAGAGALRRKTQS